MKLICLTFGLSVLFIESFTQIVPPYINDFDDAGDDAGWIHYAAVGTDDWMLGTPTNGAYNSAYTQPSAWYTSVGSNAAMSSSRFLETPEFDLSGFTEPLALSFVNKRDFITTANMQVQYSIDGGANWIQLDNVAAKKKNWNFAIDANSFTTAAVSLDALMGETSVSFRFAYYSPGFSSLGWLIDNFSIDYEYYDLDPQDASVREFFVSCDTWEMDVNCLFNNQFSASFANTTEFYLSTDMNLDESDSLVHTGTWNMTFGYVNDEYPVPAIDVEPGDYYIIYITDVLNLLEENNEDNNIGILPLTLLPVTLPGYSDDFEDSETLWKVVPDANDTSFLWEHGPGYDINTFGAHSGNNAWHVSREIEGNDNINFSFTYINQEVHSPTFDLSDPPPTLCMSFWFKIEATYEASETGIYMATRYGCQGESSTPYVLYPAEVHEGWRFFTKNITNTVLANQDLKSYVFKSDYGNWSDHDDFGLTIDDFYIGEIKPDLSIEGEKKNCFVDVNATNCTLKYQIVNTGLVLAPATTSRFYYSEDEVLDAGDELLGEINEPIVDDAFRTMRSFDYVKPSTTNDFYIIYQLDATGVVDEMREFDNTGAFYIRQENYHSVPYNNDFEIQIDDWSHASSFNEDEWNWSVVNGGAFDQAFSGERAWLFGDSGIVHTWRLNHLYSPVFDLTGLDDPMLDFDLYFGLVQNYQNMTYSRGINLEYSINGGTEWNILNATDGPIDDGGMLEDYGMAQFNLWNNRATQIATHYFVDLLGLQNQSSVQFRFNAFVGNYGYNTDTLTVDGVMIDNFRISEGNPELVLQYRELMLNEEWDEIIFNTLMYNNGTAAADSCDVQHFLSTDAILDAGDLLLGEYTYVPVNPDYVRRTNHHYDVPGGIANYEYLLLKLDPMNEIHEGNEANNFSAWPLTDVVTEFPYLENFNDSILPGWNFRVYRYNEYEVRGNSMYNLTNNGTDGVNDGDNNNRRFQSTVVPSFTPENGTPEFTVYTPTFDFSGIDSIRVSFNLAMEAWDEQGVNLSYSINDGDTWPLYSEEDALIDEGMINWYSEDDSDGGSPFSGGIDWLDNAPGWSFFTAPLDVSGNASFLRDIERVTFRFLAQASSDYNGDESTGWSIDDFLVETYTADYCAADSMVALDLDDMIQDQFVLTYHAQNLGQTHGRPSKTIFYWSADDVLDTENDELAVYYNETNFLPVDNFVTHIIPMSLSLPPGTGYLFYVLDTDDDIVETNEENNIGSFEVSIPSLINYTADGPQILFADHNIPTIPVAYEVGNPGTYDGEVSTTKYYWSDDDVLDGGDLQFVSVNLDPVPHIAGYNVLDNLEYPTPIEQQDYYLFYELDSDLVLDETDEGDNMGVIHVDFYYWEPIGVIENGKWKIKMYYNENEQACVISDAPNGMYAWFVYNSIGQLLEQGNCNIGSSPFVIPLKNTNAAASHYFRLEGKDLQQTISFFNH